MEKLEKKETSQDILSENESGPFLEWKYHWDEKTGAREFDALALSDGSQIDTKKLKTIVKKATGTSDLTMGEKLLKRVAGGMSNEKEENRLNEVSILLTALQPKNETEALLLGQFLALNDSAIKCLRLANLDDQGFYHVEKLFILANKLFNTANQTMQTLLKYRSGGQQTVQVVHVHNEGQAIVAQNLSSHPSGEGSKKKS